MQVCRVDAMVENISHLNKLIELHWIELNWIESDRSNSSEGDIVNVQPSVKCCIPCTKVNYTNWMKCMYAYRTTKQPCFYFHSIFRLLKIVFLSPTRLIFIPTYRQTCTLFILSSKKTISFIFVPTVFRLCNASHIHT